MATQIPATYEDAARTLAEWQSDGGPRDLRIALFPDPDRKVVRLIEISNEFSQIPEVRPLTFGASRELPFTSSVALLAPKVWRSVLKGMIPLPSGWQLDSVVWIRGGDGR